MVANKFISSHRLVNKLVQWSLYKFRIFGSFQLTAFFSFPVVPAFRPYRHSSRSITMEKHTKQRQ